MNKIIEKFVFGSRSEEIETDFHDFVDELGVSSPALTLFFSILLGYPIAYVYRIFIRNQSSARKHAYCFLTGLGLGFFNFGFSIGHCFFTTVVTYYLMSIKNKKLGLILSWIFNVTYLCAGYYFTETEDYDILWTMPQCVLCLRMIGWAFDIYDSYTMNADERSSTSKDTILTEMPKLYEVLGYAFFPSSFLIGPQYPFARYLKFIENRFVSELDVSEDPRCVTYGMLTCLSGFFYLAVSQLIGAKYFSDDMLTSDAFDKMPFLARLVYLGIWGRTTLYKYIACWLLSEGACAMFGLTFSRLDEDGKTYWDGCKNVKLATFESASRFTDYIASFNCNTNRWIGDYVYKRLKFLNNKMISQLASLAFLAVWHGFHSGYYITFALEFAVVYFERDLAAIINKNDELRAWLTQGIQSKIIKALQHVYTFIFMGFCLIPFVLRVSHRYWLAFSKVHYIGAFFILWPLIRWFVKPLLGFLNNAITLTDGYDGAVSPPTPRRSLRLQEKLIRNQNRAAEETPRTTPVAETSQATASSPRRRATRKVLQGTPSPTKSS